MSATSRRFQTPSLVLFGGSVRVRLALVRLFIVAAAIGLAAIGREPTIVDAQSAQARIWTDKSTYVVGESIRICFAVPGPGPIAIYDIQNGNSKILVSWNDDGRGDCISGTITPPTGQECFRLDYRSNNGSGSVQTCIQVLPALGTGPAGGPMQIGTIRLPNSTQQLTPGCNLVAVPSPETVQQVATRVDPEWAVVSTWRQISGTTQYQGAANGGNVPGGVGNLSSINAMEHFFLCVSAPATYRSDGARGSGPLPTGSPPNRVFGTAQLNGRQAPAGMSVIARVGSTDCGMGQVSASGTYAVDVRSAATQLGCGMDGVTVGFSVGGTQTSQTTTWRQGAFTQLDLTAGQAPAQLQVDIWTDKLFYRVGEQIQVCFWLSAPAYIRVIDFPPRAPSQILFEWMDDGRGDCRWFEVTPPEGSEVVRIEVWANQRDSLLLPPAATDEAGFEVVPAASNASLSIAPQPSTIERGTGQTSSVQWTISESNGIDITFGWRTWEIYGCLDNDCLIFTDALYGTEKGNINPSLHVDGYGTVTWRDTPGAGGCSGEYRSTLLAMTFWGIDDSRNSVSVTGYVRVDCTNGPPLR